MEVKMGISVRWQLADAQYIETIKYLSQRNYHCTLDRLQRLVIQWLFELNKLNLSVRPKALIKGTLGS
jgi:hypothetical protein